jgi:EcsC family protein
MIVGLQPPANFGSRQIADVGQWVAPHPNSPFHQVGMHEQQKPLSAEDLCFLDKAAIYLEEPSFVMQVANLVGKPAEWMLSKLPSKAQAIVGDLTQKALRAALYLGVRSLSDHRLLAGGPRTHTALTAITGAAGGFFGWRVARFEIPFTTTVMMRSIAQIAKRNGSDLADPETLIQCLSVFGYGAPKRDAKDSAFLHARAAMAREMESAAAFIAGRSAEWIEAALNSGSAPALMNVLNKIAARFQVEVTEKFAAEAIPIVGAIGGGSINSLFTHHFNRVAKYEFGIARLERQSGRDVVEAAYLKAVEKVKRRGSSDGPNGGGTGGI